MLLCNTIMTNADKHKKLFAHAKLQYSIKKLKEQKGTYLRHQMKQISGVSTNRLLDVWETLFSFREYFLSNTFSQNIKYCSVAF